MESSHRHLKDAVDQTLILRGHRDFADRAAYGNFVREVVIRRNRRNAAAFNVEREHLRELPLRRTTDFVAAEARVTRCGTFTVRGILYSAPSRLIRHRLKVRVYPARINCYLSGDLVHSTAHGSHAGNSRRRALDYRHFVDALKCKPQAFKGLAFRDDPFPREAYRRTREQLEARMTPRDACKTMVGLLNLAALAVGELPDFEQLRGEFASRQAQCPEVVVETPAASLYDTLLDEGETA